jgi:NAD(P)-dependent dehydrogenase (short-subunit alcohol dehydrogenase family)
MGVSRPQSTDSTATRVAVVTGASGGLGRAIVRELAGRGYDIGLLARGRAGLDAAADEVRRAGRRAVAVPTDVADWEQVDAAATRVTDELGPIDVWVNNAMTTVFAAVVDTRPEELRRATEVTYLGQVHGTMAALARMRKADRGTIVSVGSALAYRGIPMQSAYCGSKFAVRGFMESLRSELLAEGSPIRVSQVHMPAMNTPQFGWCRAKTSRHPMPVPPIYQPERCAEAVAAVIERGQRQKIYCVWNWMLVKLNAVIPGVGDHYMARTGLDSQLTDIPIEPDRPDDLHEPVDDVSDHGARGIFDGQTGGMLTWDFVRSLPSTAASAGRAGVARVREVLGARL